MITLSDGGCFDRLRCQYQGKEFLSRFSADGKLLWTKTYGEKKDEEGEVL